MTKEKKIVVFDEDEFYPITVDLVLHSLGVDSCESYSNQSEYKTFLKNLENNKFNGAFYIIDEFFLKGGVNLVELVEKIRKYDKSAKVISHTVSVPPEDNEDNKKTINLYDDYIVKSSRSNNKTLIKVLSELLGIEFVFDNSDPEFELNK